MTLTVRKSDVPEVEDVAFTAVPPTAIDAPESAAGGIFLAEPPTVATAPKKSRLSFFRSKNDKSAKPAQDEATESTVGTAADVLPSAAAADDVSPSFFSTVRKAVAPGVRRKRLDTPVRVLIGFLPEVSQRDALEFAQGVAEKHCEQLSISFYAAIKMGEGYAYEVHEGGSGRGYLTAILKYFKDLPPFEQGEPHRVHIRTATRSVEVERTREGLVAVLLPESEQVETTDWLEPGEKLRAAISQRTGMLVVGAVVFVSGFCAMLMAQYVRHQPYSPHTPQSDIQVNYDQLPMGQWRSLQNLGPNEYIRTLRFDGKAWSTEKGVESSNASEHNPPAASTTTPPPPPASGDVGPGPGHVNAQPAAPVKGGQQ